MRKTLNEGKKFYIYLKEKKENLKTMVALFERNIMLILLILFVMNKYVSSTVEENQDDVYSNSSQVVKSRMKRYLSFQPGTRIFVSFCFVICTNVGNKFL